MTESMKLVLFSGIDIFFKLLNVLIFVRIVLSWFPINPNGNIMVILRTLTEPILGPIRRLVQNSPLGGRGMILDFSPVIALFLMQILQGIIVSVIGAL